MVTADATCAAAPAYRGEFRDPVFVLAPARSYTTVTIALLAGHPHLYGLPETNLFAGANLSEMGKGTVGRQGWQHHQPPGLLRAIAQLHHGRQDPTAIQRAAEWLRARAGAPSVTIMDHVLRLVHPQTAAEKSPSTAGSVQALTRCLRAYPNARYLHLTRHPVSSVRSMNAHWSTHLFPARTPQEERVRGCLHYWYSTHLRIIQALRGLPRHQWRRLRAEDLVGAPRAMLPLVLDWLVLDHDDAIIDRMLHTQHWEFAPSETSSGFGGADPKFSRDPKLHSVPPPQPELTDPRWDISDEIQVRINILARYLGY
jgi:Sulfotransferase family